MALLSRQNVGARRRGHRIIGTHYIIINDPLTQGTSPLRRSQLSGTHRTARERGERGAPLDPWTLATNPSPP